MDNKNRVKLADFIRGNLRDFLILIFVFSIQYSVLSDEDPVKTFTPDLQIQEEISRIVSSKPGDEEYRARLVEYLESFTVLAERGQWS